MEYIYVEVKLKKLSKGAEEKRKKESHLPDNLDKLFGVMWGKALELAGATL